MVEGGGPLEVGLTPGDVPPADWRERKAGPGLDVLDDLSVVLVVLGQSLVAVLRPLLPPPGRVRSEVLGGLPSRLLEDTDQAHGSLNDISQ